eukprot:CAMPEP_0117694688 /NCGR_PEP_ID=MMETSP0804-20121206/27636_1 /TAXON_ID=1074897 /ORGANISM="Tetraselmis astigmatica, Strain CCMP880" /LENGTH=34 /DNA_ID= /DNA_START= /DNA_END= /DNA_ORIENTATION=
MTGWRMVLTHESDTNNLPKYCIANINEQRNSSVR